MAMISATIVKPFPPFVGAFDEFVEDVRWLATGILSPSSTLIGAKSLSLFWSDTHCSFYKM
jgi:hypothetical protein